MNEMFVYDQMPDYDEHICPVTAGGYCPYGTSSEHCKSCEELKAMEEFYETKSNGVMI